MINKNTKGLEFAPRTSANNAAKDLEGYWNTYSRAPRHKDYSASMFTDDALHQLGIAIDPWAYSSFSAFKGDLISYLSKELPSPELSLLSEINEYLNINKETSIASNSQLHQKCRDILGMEKTV
jgi:hypothetical protein